MSLDFTKVGQARLYHGSSPKNMQSARQSGLRPGRGGIHGIMSRKLTETFDEDTARRAQKLLNKIPGLRQAPAYEKGRVFFGTGNPVGKGIAKAYALMQNPKTLERAANTLSTSENMRSGLWASLKDLGRSYASTQPIEANLPQGRKARIDLGSGSLAPFTRYTEGHVPAQYLKRSKMQGWERKMLQLIRKLR